MAEPGREILPPPDTADPDQVRGELAGIAAALAADPLHAVRTWEQDAQRMAVLFEWLDGHLRTGGALPTAYAADRTAADDPPVTEVQLPEGEILTARGRLAVRARQAADAVKTAHRPVKSRQDADRRFCVVDGEPWPCETATLGAAVATFGPPAMWLAAHKAALAFALNDAAAYREPEGEECGECNALNEGHRTEGGGRTVLCPDCGADDQIRKAHEQLLAELEGLDL